MNYPILKVKNGRDWSIRRGHPWLFSGALQNPSSGLKPGTLVDLVDVQGEFLARGYYNSKTDIAVRILTRNPEEEIGPSFFQDRVLKALQLRQLAVNFEECNAYRLINAEGDFFPGAIVDSYAGYLVLQSHTAGMDLLTQGLVEALEEEVKPQGILLRNDVGVRSREGLAKEEPRLLKGQVPNELEIKENGFRFKVNLWSGQKTGFFTDQRDKRKLLGRYAPGLSAIDTGINKPVLLNCFSYSAGFSVYSAKENTQLQTINVDQSAAALALAQENFKLNKLDPSAHEFIASDVFKYLEGEISKGSVFEGIILDPPAFAKTHRDKERALNGYTHLNALGIRVLKPGGLLVTCSCSGSVSLDEFENSLKETAAKLSRQVQVLHTFENAPDHPFNLAAPEGRYLKVLFCRVL